MTKYPVSKKIRRTAAALLLSTAMVLPLPVANGGVADFAVTNVSAATKTIKLSQKNATLYVKDTLKLTLKNATASKINWSSSNPKVAKVNSKGKITALKGGTATITAKYKKKTYKCKVTVYDPEVIEGMDLGGMEIIIRDWWSGYSSDDVELTEFEKAQEQWRDYIQKTYNFTIKHVSISDWGGTPSDFVDYVTTNGDDNNYVFVLRKDPVTTSAMTTGLMYDLATIPYLDFSEDKYKRSNNDELYSVGKSIYAISENAYAEPRTGVYFNKQVLKDAGIDPESLYDMQANGTWTWDKFDEICQKVQRDVDGDGELDYYGITVNEGVMVDAAIFSNNGSYIGKKKSGYYYNLESENTLEALNWCVDMFNKYDEKAPAYGEATPIINYDYKGGVIKDKATGQDIWLDWIQLYDEGYDYYTYDEFQAILDRNGLVYDSDLDLYFDHTNKCYYGTLAYHPSGPQWDYYKTEFVSGNVAFCIDDAYCGTSINWLAEASAETGFDFGFVMFPKGPKADTYVNCWYENLCVIPSCYSKDKAEKIAFAFNLYTETPPGYTGYKDLEYYKKKSSFDDRAINETLSMMMDPEHSAVDYSSVIPNLQLGADFMWSIAPGANVALNVNGVRDKWKKYVKDANNK